MEQYRVNDQPISENLFFWKYTDYPQIKQNQPQKRTWTPTKPSSSLQKKSKSPIKEKIIATKLKQEEQELAQCTFKPKLISNNARYWNQNENDFLQRCQMWNEQKQAKITKQKLCEVENDLRDCTFAPKIIDYKPILQTRTPKQQNTEKLSQQYPQQQQSTQQQQYQFQQTFSQTQQIQTQQTQQSSQSKSPVKYRYSDAMHVLHRQLHM